MTTETINHNFIEQAIKIKDRLETDAFPSEPLTFSKRGQIEDIPSSFLIKRKRDPPKGKYITAPWRYKEDGTYNKNPLDKNYFNDYYRDHWHSEKTTCPLCNREVIKNVLRRHQNSKICKRIHDNNIVK